MAVTKSNKSNITSPNGNSLALFIDINDDKLKMKDINGEIQPLDDFVSVSGGTLQIEGGALINSTLQNVTDAENNVSQLQLATNATKINGNLEVASDLDVGGNTNIDGNTLILGTLEVDNTTKIKTANETYLDIEDGAGNNRFTIGKATGSQKVTLDYASNPTSSTEIVGSIRTYQDGTNLSDTMSFRRDGNIAIGNITPTSRLSIKGSGSTSATNSFLLQNSSGTQLGYIDDSGQWMIGTGTNGGYSLDINGSLRSGVINLRVNSGLIRYDTNNYIQLPNQGGPVSGIFADAGYGWLYSNGSQVYSRLLPGNGTTIASSWRISQSTSNVGKNDIVITTDLTNAIGSQSTGEAISMLNVNNFAASPPYAYRPSLKIRAGNSGEQNGADKYQPAGHLYLEAGDANSGTATNIAGGNMYLNAGKGTGTGTPGDVIFSTSTTTTSGTTLQTLSNRLWVKGTTGNVGIDVSSPTARLQVKGSGATSATTSLLVQNSAGTQLGYVDDSGQWQIGTGTNGGYNLDVNGTARVRGNFENTIGVTTSRLINMATDGTAFGRIEWQLSAATSLCTGRTGTGTGTARNFYLVWKTTNYGVSSQRPLILYPDNGFLYWDAAATSGTDRAQNASAFVEIDSTTRGFLPPRMTTAQKNAIASPAAGLVVYDTTLNKLCVYTTAWETITSV